MLPDKLKALVAGTATAVALGYGSAALHEHAAVNGKVLQSDARNARA
jgi:hypothetical protein